MIVKKALLPAFVFILMAFAMLPAIADRAFAEPVNIESGGVCYSADPETGTAVVTDYSPEELPAALEIPETINNYTVTSIGFNAFSRAGLTSVKIPASVKSIETQAFREINSLTSVTFASGSELESIGNYAFVYTGLTSLHLPAGVTSIGTRAFGNTRLTTVEIPANVTSLGEGVFSSCESLTTIKLPANLTSLGDSAFGYSGLTTIELPANLTSLGNGVFSGCNSLKSVKLPANLTSIGEEAFLACASLKTIEIPASVTSIGKSAFSCCESLATINLPAGLTSIESGVFIQCYKLKSIEIPANVTNIGELAFCNSALTSITIPTNVTSIGESAFNGCESLTTVKLPASLRSIGVNAFANCYALTTAVFSGTKAQWDAVSVGENNTILTSLIFGIKSITLSSKKYTYNGQIHKPTITTIAIGGKVLKEGTDYTVTWSEKSSKNAGTYKVTVTGEGDYHGKKTATYKIDPKKITPAVTLSESAFTWTGKFMKPAKSGVTVKDGSTAVSTFVVGCETDGKNVGKQRVEIRLYGNYSGTKTVYYKITPKGTSLKSLTKAKKAITVKWAKQGTKMPSSHITGYQIQLATNSAFTKDKKTVTVTGYSKGSKKITGLKGGKKYYVKIHTYMTVNGTKYYSPWSKTKTVTTKK